MPPQLGEANLQLLWGHSPGASFIRIREIRKNLLQVSWTLTLFQCNSIRWWDGSYQGTIETDYEWERSQWITVKHSLVSMGNRSVYHQRRCVFIHYLNCFNHLMGNPIGWENSKHFGSDNGVECLFEVTASLLWFNTSSTMRLSAKVWEALERSCRWGVIASRRQV